MATQETTVTAKELDAGMMIRRALFLLLLIGVTYYYLGIDFRGLGHPKGMDQAQIARQIANEKSFTTLCIRPICYAQVDKEMKKENPADAPSFADGIPDAYHSPLNPILNSIVLGLFRKTWEFQKDQKHYAPDIIITGVSMVLLLASIGVTYLLISRIFDARIGGVTALLMLLCETMWRYSQSGLPQMLMLFLFSFAIYFLYKAVENTQSGKPVYLWLGLTGGFMGLLALAHWMAVWPFLGLVLFAGFYFHPRGVQLLMLIGVFLLITIWWPFFNNMRYTGNPLGAGIYLFYAGNANAGSEASLMRDLEQTTGALDLNGLPSKMMLNSVTQLGDLYNYLGAIVVAPLFFLSLLHPFRRREIADFRWCIFAMWIFAVGGMTIYGLAPIGDDLVSQTDSNNLHIIFAPVMTGYGLAFLSVLWNRLNLPLQIPVVRNGHFILAIFVSILPMLLKAPTRITQAVVGGKWQQSHAPYYIPEAIVGYSSLVKPNEAIVTDIPWAVAWYGNRTAIWLPKDRGQLEQLRTVGKERGQPITGMLLSRYTLNTSPADLLDPRTPEHAWRDYILFNPLLSLGASGGQNNEATRRANMIMLSSDLPIKYGVSNYNGVYLFMTENPVVKTEDEESAETGN
jgi:hypothetical protein